MKPARTPPLPAPRVLLGVTGSIAAYKAVLLARMLLERGARVQVVMTPAAQRFIGKATFSGLTGQPVQDDLFGGSGEPHVSLAASHDCLIVAPATADFVARAAQGRASDLLGALWLCFRGPKFVAPAMHPQMWNHQATQRNIEQLRADGTHILGPAYGVVASGDSGVGRMVEPAEILEGLSREFDRKRDLVGQRVVVSAGPTVEDLDPVRFLSNRSSGKMGFALAAAAAARGATVDLVAGPVSLPTPQGVQRHDVRSALEMLQKLRALLADPCAALFMAAAVGDYRAEAPQTKKIKRDGAMALKLAENPDLIATIAAELRRNPPAEAAGKSGSPLLVAFALETGTDAEVVRAATQKRAKKGVDYVVANSVAEALGGDDNRVTLVGPAHPEPWPTLTKRQVADRLLTALLVPVQGAQVLHGECPL